MILRTLCILAAVALTASRLSAQIEQVHIPQLHDVTGVAADDTLNIRAEASGAAAIIGELGPFETGIEVTALNSSGAWGRIIAGETDGWVSMAYLSPRPLPSGGFPNGMRCYGTEPFWSIDFSDGMATYSEMGDAQPQTGSFFAARLYDVVSGFDIPLPNHDLSGVIEPASCTDGMSDRTFGWQLLLLTRQGNARHLLHGCCTLDQR
ncbi:SH3 domain-containing protein [Aliiruegeria lutimaris]|uniref:SH3b domain-containing protein n=1 Tax=Aliiruegeria lutimaris TaxID=571298 RepID=A0A1G8NNH5_9RHOB|nr:SH3 domain-containing protein [Aliiruegeria lutimaris]SDI81050.1 hypothetical protein SAMN04488026_100794 [Aliiruegeria lutimaris]